MLRVMHVAAGVKRQKSTQLIEQYVERGKKRLRSSSSKK